jgi:hypothetical protein
MITIVPIEESAKWDSIVKSFDRYDVYYLSCYAKAYERIGDGKPLLFYYESDTAKAMNVVMKRDIAESKPFLGKLEKNRWFDLSTPYGYGGFWIEGEDCESLEKEYVELCKEKGYISEFIRFHLYTKYTDVFEGKIESCTGNVVCPLDPDMEDIIKGFEHKVRKNMKRAHTAGLQVEIDEEGRRLKDFLDVYYGTMDRKDAKSYYYFPEEFFHTINELKENTVYIHVLYEDKVISTELILYGKENGYSFLGGTDSRYFHLRPNDFLKVEAIKWLKEKGLKRFVLGGGYGKDDGIFRFKKSFAPDNIRRFYIGKRIFNREKYDEIMAIRNGERGFQCNNGFFPQYREF